MKGETSRRGRRSVSNCVPRAKGMKRRREETRGGETRVERSWIYLESRRSRQARNESRARWRNLPHLAARERAEPSNTIDTGIPISHFSHFPTRGIEFHLDFRPGSFLASRRRVASISQRGNFISSTYVKYIKYLLRNSIPPIIFH